MILNRNSIIHIRKNITDTNSSSSFTIDSIIPVLSKLYKVSHVKDHNDPGFYSTGGNIVAEFNLFFPS